MSKKRPVFLSFLAVALFAGFARAQEMPMEHNGMGGHMHPGMMHGGMSMRQDGQDSRIPLNNPPMMRGHMLSMMRQHLQAVTEITGMIAAGEFEKASKTAHEKLGLTPEMKKMCDMMGNEQYAAMGMAFHESGDTLGDVLAKKDMKASLKALNETLNHCVNCHNTFRR